MKNKLIIATSVPVSLSNLSIGQPKYLSQYYNVTLICSLGKDIDKITVVDLMTPNPIAINIKSPLKDAIILMEDRKSQISVLPVINDDGKTCAGLLRLHDIYQTNLF